jgi:uncharacterized protein YciI
MKYFILFYKTIDDYKEKRAPYRSLHFEYIKDYIKRGEIIMGGALENPADEAIIIFHCSDRSVAESFAKSDPYVINGVISSWRVREWNEVVKEKISLEL